MDVKSAKGFTIMELLVALTILAIIGAIAITQVKSYLYNAKVSAVASDVRAVVDAVDSYRSDMGVYPYAPRCFVDTSWASFNNVCGDTARWNGKYIRKVIDSWVDCSTDPTASETNKLGCYNLTYGTVEITNTKGTHGAVVLQGLDEATALDIFAVLTGKDVGAYGTTYSTASVPKTETEGKALGAWIELNATTNKYDIFIDF